MEDSFKNDHPSTDEGPWTGSNDSETLGKRDASFSENETKEKGFPPGGGGAADPKKDRTEGFWALPSVRSYLSRIGAEPRSLKRAWVCVGEGRYTRDVRAIDFAPDGKVTVKVNAYSKAVADAEGYAPTEEEQAAIRAEAKDVKLPKQIPWDSAVVPDHLDKLPNEHLFCFKNINGEVICYQERREDKDGKRSFHFWTYYSDGKWRQMEPEGGLPIFGLEKLRDNRKERIPATVYLHEGAKAARAMQNIKEENPDHPWFDELVD